MADLAIVDRVTERLIIEGHEFTRRIACLEALNDAVRVPGRRADDDDSLIARRFLFHILTEGSVLSLSRIIDRTEAKERTKASINSVMAHLYQPSSRQAIIERAASRVPGDRGREVAVRAITDLDNLFTRTFNNAHIFATQRKMWKYRNTFIGHAVENDIDSPTYSNLMDFQPVVNAFVRIFAIIVLGERVDLNERFAAEYRHYERFWRRAFLAPGQLGEVLAQGSLPI